MTWKKTNQEIVYSALIHGLEATIDGSVYRMDEGGDLALRCEKESGGVKSHVWMAAYMGGMPMDHFYRLCEKMTSGEKAEIVAAIVLNKTAGKR